MHFDNYERNIWFGSQVFHPHIQYTYAMSGKSTKKNIIFPLSGKGPEKYLILSDERSEKTSGAMH